MPNHTGPSRKPAQPAQGVPSPAPAPAPEGPPPAYVPPATREKRQRSVVHYVAILFSAAFLLLLLTYLMDQRQNEVVMDSINASMSDLRESLSNANTVQDIYEDNQTLLAQVEDLEDQLEELRQEQQALAIQLQEEQNAALAMDWFWQIDEAYVLGRYSLCRELIASLEASGLAPFLPQESITDNGRFSPAGRYQEICDALA